jgi:hypothetical protein
MKQITRYLPLILITILCMAEPAIAASLKSKIQTFSRNLSTIGIAVGIGSCVVSGLALQSQYRGALIWFRSSVVGTAIVILAPVIINTVARAVR